MATATARLKRRPDWVEGLLTQVIALLGAFAVAGIAGSIPGQDGLEELPGGRSAPDGVAGSRVGTTRPSCFNTRAISRKHFLSEL